MFRLAAVWLAKKKLPQTRHVRVVTTVARRKTKPPAKRRSSPRTQPSLTRTKTRVPTMTLATTKAATTKTITQAPPRDAHVNNVVRVQAAASVDASEKKPQYSLATAVSTIIVPPAANYLLEGMKQTLTPSVQRPNDGGACNNNSNNSSEGNREPVSQMEEFYTSKKGPLFATAVIAGTNAVKQASQLIPFCHPVRIQKCSFTFRRRTVAGLSRTSALPHRVVLCKRVSPPPPPSRARGECSVLYCFCTVATDDTRAGVEMEALTGANVACLTLYDMLRNLPGSQEDGLGIGESFVLARRGGKNDFTKLLMSEMEAAPPPPLQTLSSSSSAEEEGEGGRDEAAGMLTEGEAAAPAFAPSASQLKTQNSSSNGGDDGNSDVDGDVTTSEGNMHIDNKPREQQLPQQEEDGAVVKKKEVHNMTGDKNAWWKSTSREKKPQQLYPRRKTEESGRNSHILTSVISNSRSFVSLPKKVQHAKMSSGKKDLKDRKIKLKRGVQLAKGRKKPVNTTLVKRRVSNSSRVGDGDLSVDEKYDVVPTTGTRRLSSSFASDKHTSSVVRKVVSKGVVDIGVDSTGTVAEDSDEEDVLADDAFDSGTDVVSMARHGKRQTQRKGGETKTTYSNNDYGSRHKEEEEEDGNVDDEGDESLARQLKTTKKIKKILASPVSRRLKTSEVAMPVKHDTWDNETEIEGDYDQGEDGALDYLEEEEEEILPSPHRSKKAPKSSRSQRLVTRR